MFTHLRAYSTYSIGYGAMQVKEYVKQVKSLGMTACALTEVGVLYSAIEFVSQCKDNEIRPILGLDVSVKESEGIFQLLLLAENEAGYKNLMKLSTDMQKTKIDGQPCATIDDLKACASRGNVFLLTGHRQSKYGLYALRNRIEDARELVELYQLWFGKDRVYFEIQDHQTQSDRVLAGRIFSESKRYGIPAVLTNQNLYTVPARARKHILCRAVAEGRTAEEVERSVLPDCHVRSEEEMAALYASYPELIENTEALANRIDLQMNFNQKFHPQAVIPEGETESSYLRKQIRIGFERRWGHLPKDDPYRKKVVERLAYEIPIVEKMGYSGYLIIVSEFIRWAIDNYGETAIGKGRGSGAGSLVLQCMDITDVDPIRWDLLFERFLNPERVSDPDIDTDIAPSVRDSVVEHCIDLYGEERVASIITFMTMAARASVRDAGRVTGADPSLVDRVAKLIPEKPKITIDLALGHSDNPDKIKEFYSPDFASAMADPAVKALVEDALLLEGLIRGTSVHAAGKIISSVPVGDVCPLKIDDETGQWVTQFDGPTCEKIGLMKMDFLGLETLTLIDRTLEFIHRTTGQRINLNDIPFDDKDVIREIYAKGRTVAVFQFESAGMRRMLQEFQPTCLEDLILLNAAYRPGPMAYIPEIIKNKNNPSGIKYDVDAFEPILAETYGKPIYQEQIMKMFTIAGFSLGTADIIRRGMSKKKEKELAKYKEPFLNACIELGMAPERTEEFWHEIMEFAKYCFNKSHAAAYSIDSYFTGWLKYHYPAEFMAAAMSVQKMEKLPGLIQECRLMDISILGPDINLSDGDFTPEGRSVRFGLRRIKGVAGAADKIVQERLKNGPFQSLTDFVSRCSVNSKVMRCLAEGGALDSLGHSRGGFVQLVEDRWSDIQKMFKKSKKDSAQLALFDLDVAIPDIEVPEPYRPWTPKETFQKEYAVLQAYINGHPADAYKGLRTRDFYYLSDLDESCNGRTVTIMALIDTVNPLYRKSDRAPMAKLSLSDGSGSITAMLFTKSYAALRDRIGEQEVRIFKGIYQHDENEPQLVVEDIEVPSTSQKFYVRVPTRTKEWSQKVVQVAQKHMGVYPLLIYIADENSMVSARQTVDPTFLDEAKRVFGERSVAVMG